MVLVECVDCGYMKAVGARCVVCACEDVRRQNEVLARIRSESVRKLGGESSRAVHRAECPAYGVSKWAEVDTCGPCDYLDLRDAMRGE